MHWRVRHGRRRGHTVNEEQMRGGILLVAVREVAYDAVDVGRRRHDEVHRLHRWLRLAVVRDRLNHCMRCVSATVTRAVSGGLGGDAGTRTSHIFLQDVELLEDGAQELL